MPQTTIIVPVYNVEKYLNRCIDSIIAQTFTDWECILVDDGSPDNCGKICNDYAEKDSRIKVIHQMNLGLAGARNSGLKIAKGKYVVFLDSDDYVSVKWLENLILSKNEHSQSLVFGKIVSAFYQNDILVKEEILDYESKEYDFSDLLLNHIPLFSCNILYDNEIIQQNNLLFPTDVIIEDLPFVLKYLSCSKNNSAFVSSFSDYYYVHDERETLSRKYYKNSFKKYQEKYRSLSEFISINISDSQRKIVLHSVSNDYIYHFLRSLTNTYDKRNHDCMIKKFIQNYKIITSSEFQKCLKYSEINEKGYVGLLNRKMNIAAIIYERLSALKNFLR